MAILDWLDFHLHGSSDQAFSALSTSTFLLCTFSTWNKLSLIVIETFYLLDLRLWTYTEVRTTERSRSWQIAPCRWHTWNDRRGRWWWGLAPWVGDCSPASRPAAWPPGRWAPPSLRPQWSLRQHWSLRPLCDHSAWRSQFCSSRWLIACSGVSNHSCGAALNWSDRLV